MLSPPQYLSSLSCELRIIKARNIELKSSTNGGLFVRYYLSTGRCNKRVQLNTQEISPNYSDLIWNESFSLECLGSEDSIINLKQQSVVFELRWRKAVPFLGKKCKSQLLGRAEVPWKTVFESPNMEIEKWVSMVPKSPRVYDEDVKPPSLQVAMKVEVPKMVEVEKKKKKEKNDGLKKWNDECGCRDGGACNCADYEIFALVAALEAL